MSKKVIVEAVAREAGMTPAAADKVVSSVLEAISAELENGEKVSFPGFGTVEVGAPAARTIRNPQTGALIRSAESKPPASKAPAFKSPRQAQTLLADSPASDEGSAREVDPQVVVVPVVVSSSSTEPTEHRQGGSHGDVRSMTEHQLEDAREWARALRERRDRLAHDA
ncbi:HU family DNA-binding protein [Serinicoccus sp. CNJ-927]|uniref:HU family DNA-binding protein n=1 Tax=Serinicoccus sp. CNJ-927 TaxID=1904970 RepID=UPI0026BF3522